MRNGLRVVLGLWLLSSGWVFAQAPVAMMRAAAGAGGDEKKEHLHVGEAAPPDLKINGKITIGSMHGKPVLLHIWATWCGPCMASMPTFHRLVDQYAKTDLQVILLDRDDDFAKAHQYLLREGIVWPDYHDSGRFFKEFGGHGIPATVVIDRDGVVRYHHTGEGLSEKSVGKLERTLNRAITRPVTPAGQTPEAARDEDPDKP